MFALVCLLLACYLTNTQIIRYFENRDASTITYKLFNQSPRDRYPTYSVCLKGPEIYWDHERYLFENLGITSAQYVQLLKGEGMRYEYNESTEMYTKEPIDMKNDSKIDLKNVSPNPAKIILGVDFVTQQHNHTVHYGIGTAGLRLQKHPFFIGYQTFDEICFTRNSIDEVDKIRLHDFLSMNRSLLDPGNHLKVELRIIFHYPGQLLRSFENPSFRSTLGAYIGNKVLEMKVSHVTILRKREDSNVPCNKTIENDDLKVQQEILKLIGCIPPYWIFLIGDYEG